MELVEFLRARFADDERAANTLDELGGWERNGIESTAGGHVLDYLDHFSSARMLDDVAADRRILDLYEQTEFGDFTRRTALEEVLQVRALRYAGHPDYDPAWTIE